MGLSLPAQAFLNGLLMEAADRVVVGDGYVLDRATAEEVRGELQRWRDELGTSPELVSGALVGEAFAAFAALPDLALLARVHPNDAELGGQVRAFAPKVAQVHARVFTLLSESLNR